MPNNDDIPDSVRAEFRRLGDDLAVQRRCRNELAPQLEELRKHRDQLRAQKQDSQTAAAAVNQMTGDLRDAKHRIAGIEKNLKELLREHGESDRDAIHRMQSTAGDPLHLKRPVAHSKLYGHGVRLGSSGDTGG